MNHLLYKPDSMMDQINFVILFLIELFQFRRNKYTNGFIKYFSLPTCKLKLGFKVYILFVNKLDAIVICVPRIVDSIDKFFKFVFFANDFKSFNRGSDDVFNK